MTGTDRSGWCWSCRRHSPGELLDAVRTNGAAIDASAWDDADSSSYSGAASVPADGKEPSWEVASEPPEGEAVPLTLDVTESTDALLAHGEVGGRIIDVHGQAALQWVDGRVTWSPSPGVPPSATDPSTRRPSSQPRSAAGAKVVAHRAQFASAAWSLNPSVACRAWNVAPH